MHPIADLNTRTGLHLPTVLAGFQRFVENCPSSLCSSKALQRHSFLVGNTNLKRIRQLQAALIDSAKGHDAFSCRCKASGRCHSFPFASSKMGPQVWRTAEIGNRNDVDAYAAQCFGHHPSVFRSYFHRIHDGCARSGRSLESNTCLPDSERTAAVLDGRNSWVSRCRCPSWEKSCRRAKPKSRQTKHEHETHNQFKQKT